VVMQQHWTSNIHLVGSAIPVIGGSHTHASMFTMQYKLALASGMQRVWQKTVAADWCV